MNKWLFEIEEEKKGVFPNGNGSHKGILQGSMMRSVLFSMSV